MCRNLKSFTWPVNSHILHYLENKTGLSELRIAAQLPVDQANRLANFNAIQSLTLFLGSSHTMKALPDWSRSIQRTLTSLVLYVSAVLLTVAILLMYVMKVLRYPKRQSPRIGSRKLTPASRLAHCILFKSQFYNDSPFNQVYANATKLGNDIISTCSNSVYQAYCNASRVTFHILLSQPFLLICVNLYWMYKE